MASVVIMFLPWTQNINANGYLTTLQADERPQEIHSTVAGRIEKWFVTEGDTVAKGDTILRLSEIKDDYFDPNVIRNLQQQIDLKGGAVQAYGDKVRALDMGRKALIESRDAKLSEAENKLEQAYLKLQADSLDYVAAQVSDSVAEVQLVRWRQLVDTIGAASRTDLEKKQKERQDARAKLISQKNKVAQSRIQITNARLKIISIRNEYSEKLAKNESDKQSVLSTKFDTETEITKMKNKEVNLERRRDFLYIVAPQKGLINKAIKPGIGETVKEGEAVVTIGTIKPELAVEVYIRPVDIPLIKKEGNVRIQFDGWPAVTFGGGWPSEHFGTFGGKIYAIQNQISSNGLYRVLISEDPEDKWPEELLVGSGVNAFVLLNNVPVWFEIWRQLNGFPPNFYDGPPSEGRTSTFKGKTKDTGLQQK